MKTISNLYPVLNMAPLAALIGFAGVAIIRQGFGELPMTASLFAYGILCLIAAATTTVLYPRHS